MLKYFTMIYLTKRSPLKHRSGIPGAEEFPMTMQVAFRAQCGLVLASDQCAAATNDSVRQTFQIDKIVSSGGFAFAGDDFAPHRGRSAE
jgi:hypothetical protein